MSKIEISSFGHQKGPHRYMRTSVNPGLLLTMIVIMVEAIGAYSKQAHLTSRWQRILDLPQVESPTPVLRQHVHKLSQRFDETILQAIINSYESGVSSKDVAEEFGISKHSVLRLLHSRGVYVRPRGLRIDYEAKRSASDD